MTKSKSPKVLQQFKKIRICKQSEKCCNSASRKRARVYVQGLSVAKECKEVEIVATDNEAQFVVRIKG